MVLKNDLSSLPAAAPSGGLEPDPQPRFGPILAQAWMDAIEEADKHKAFAVSGTRMRASWAGKCAREVQYLLREHDAEEAVARGELDANLLEGLQATEPLTVANYWTFGLGTVVHEMWQQILREHAGTLFPGAVELAIEPKVDLTPIGVSGSAHSDALLVFEKHGTKRRVLLELKTINGYGFKMATGMRGAAEGPRTSAISQAAMNALASDCDEMVVVLLSLEAASPREVDKKGWSEPWRKFTAEWTFTREVFEPIALAEAKRMARIIEAEDAGLLVPRSIPGYPKGMRVDNPERGTWMVKATDGWIVDAGTAWNCGYCSNRTRCAADGPGDI